MKIHSTSFVIKELQIKQQWEITLHLLEWLKLRHTTGCPLMTRTQSNRNSSLPEVIKTATLKDISAVSCKAKHSLSTQSSSPTPRNLLHWFKHCALKNLHMTVTAALFVIAPNWKQPRRPSVGEGQTVISHAMQYYSVVKINEQ